MSEVYFYQILDNEPFDHLRRLLTRLYQKGWRVSVHGGSKEMVEGLDRELWLKPKDSFLPHGQSGGEFDSDQPILLTAENQVFNDAVSLVLFDKAPLPPTEIDRFLRISIVFRHRYDDEMAWARQHWSQLDSDGIPIQYWAQEDRKWQKKVEKNYPPT